MDVNTTIAGDAAQVEARLNALRAAAMAGDLGAKRDLSFALLSAPRGPNDFLEGAAVTASAANDGDGETAYRTAVLIAGGVTMRQDWPVALVYLQRAAELGYGPAQEELAALSGDKALAARALNGEDFSTDVWLRLRRSVQLEAPSQSRTPKTLSVNPRIGVLENFVSPELCDALIGSARGGLQPIDGPNGMPFALDVAGSRRIAITELSLQMILLFDRIGQAVGLRHRGVEPPMVIRYSGGEAFPPHADFLDPSQPANAQNIQMEGQRIVTFLVFLNDDYEGGETDFPIAEKRFKGKKGDALFWWNVKQDGTFDRGSVNGNLPVTGGEKWILSQWLRSHVPVRPQS